MRLILLDTHAWVWWLSRDRRLKASVGKTIAQTHLVCVSSISLYEIAYAVRRGRLHLGFEEHVWFKSALASGVTILPLEAAIAVRAGGLDWSHGDPGDRCIVATAIHHGIPLVTADHQIQNSGLVDTVW